MVELCGQSPPLIAEHAAFIEFENINTIIQTEHLEDCEQEHENLDSILQTAYLLYQANQLFSDERDISGILEINDQDDLETSFSHLNIDSESTDPLSVDDTSCASVQQSTNVMKMFGFEKYKVPPLLFRHPPPATGRDDDVFKLKEILDDVLIKTCHIDMFHEGVDRILFGPDNKIGANLLGLLTQEVKYKHFLPEFPLLHLRKSKINTLFSAYKDAGLPQLLMCMCDDDRIEWTKLLSIDHIDVATKYVRRLAISFHVSFLSRFLQCIDENEANSLFSLLEDGAIVKAADTWNDRYEEFIKTGCAANATFTLHVEMMTHYDEVAVYFSDRLGGVDGYDLLLGTVKSSLLFYFLNGANAYGPFCARLLLEHYSAGHFHQHLKRTLYTTPIGNSSANFASDSKREMDHQDALRGFRSGSTLPSVTSRMPLTDSLNETHHKRVKDREKGDGKKRKKLIMAWNGD